MTQELTYAIGDIHGSIDQLDELLALIEVDAANAGHSSYRLVTLGDYVDRGAASRQVIARLRELVAKSHDVVALRGNHDQMMYDAIFHQDLSSIDLWLRNGGDKTVASYVQLDPTRPVLFNLLNYVTDEMREDAAWLRRLPCRHEDDLRFYVHAGIRPFLPFAEQSDDDLLWIREQFLDFTGQHEKYVVHGHTVTVRERDAGSPWHPVSRSNRANLDTGCVFGGPLSAGVFDNTQRHMLRFLQTKKHVSYLNTRN